MNRREFTKKALIGTAFISTAPAFGFPRVDKSSGRNLKTGIMWGTIGAGDSIPEKFQLCKKAGFDGVELMSHMDRDKVLAAREDTGLDIPSVCNSEHWNLPLSSPDPETRRKGREALEVSLQDAKAYGADTVLLVPGKVNDSVGYDECWYRSIEQIKRVVPLAEKLNVTIAIENVWNNFILSPIEARHYLDQFSSPYVKFYFDCGNILRYGWPEQWINILGHRIAKVHIKEFSREIAGERGNSAGFNVDLGEGDVNWPAVMQALDNIGYKDWVTLEQRGGDSLEGLKDLVNRTQKIVSS
ncbi:MAG: sugar phosphate isomerase/epimerase family protein [Bacteroidales bacterium]